VTLRTLFPRRFEAVVLQNPGAAGDVTGPTITSVDAPANATYYVGDNLNFTVNWDEAATVTGTPRIALTVGAATKYANYLSGSGTTALVFRYTVAETEADLDGIGMTSPIELNSGTIKDATGNNATLTFTAPNTTSVLVFTVGSLTNLISYYKEGEASGTRVDSVVASANDLTDNNTVTQAAGKVGNAAQFTAANSEYLSRVDNASLSTGDIDFTIACWVYLDSKPANVMCIASKEDAIASAAEWRMEWRNTTDRFRFIIFNSAGGATGIAADNLGVPSTATWYYVIVWHDATANTINIQVNNGTANSTAELIAIVDSTASFRIGALSTGTVGNFWNGRNDELLFCKSVLTAAQKTALYNSGNGCTYSP